MQLQLNSVGTKAVAGQTGPVDSVPAFHDVLLRLAGGPRLARPLAPAIAEPAIPSGIAQ